MGIVPGFNHCHAESEEHCRNGKQDEEAAISYERPLKGVVLCTGQPRSGNKWCRLLHLYGRIALCFFPRISTERDNYLSFSLTSPFSVFTRRRGPPPLTGPL